MFNQKAVFIVVLGLLFPTYAFALDMSDCYSGKTVYYGGIHESLNDEGVVVSCNKSEEKITVKWTDGSTKTYPASGIRGSKFTQAVENAAWGFLGDAVKGAFSSESSSK